MDQKYKFFIKQNSVTFSQDAGFGNNNKDLEQIGHDDAVLAHWVRRFNELDLYADTEIYVADLPAFVKNLKSAFRVIRAAGGYVMNGEGRLLMILRKGFWDLPKGKLDPGETEEQAAVREIEEECGVDRLHIDSGPFSTFHLYREKDTAVIKESIWYRMKTMYSGELVPQIEEDILKAEWVALPVSEARRKEAYASINEVLDHFQA